MSSNSHLSAALNLLAQFLASRDASSLAALPPVDLLVLLGSGLVESVEVAAEAMRLGRAKELLISGGIGHSTPFLVNAVGNPSLSGLSEAEIYRRLLLENHGIEADYVEDRSTNCGENALFSRELGLHPRRVLLVQDPTMQRRSHATFEKVWLGPEFVSFAPFVPNAEGQPWGFDRFVSLLLGEIERLRDDENGYGPRGRGFIAHVDIPPEVEQAYLLIRSRHAPRRAIR
jgi:uncharacterized SAM-binding protein YcdF (DUF218 family)